MAEGLFQARAARFGVAASRPTSAARLGLALLLAAAVLAVLAGPAAADAPQSPFVLDPIRSLAEQYGYEPSYARNVPVFDSQDYAYIRSRTSLGQSSSFVHTLQGGSWQRLDFTAALLARYPSMVETVGAGGLRSDSIVFDRQDRAYNPLTIRLKDGTTRNVLMVSWDRCRTWGVYELPQGEFALEHWVGHNEIDGPPFLAVWQPSTVNPAPRSKRFTLWVTKPQLNGDQLVLPPLVRVTDECLGLTKDSGGSSFAVTYGGSTTFTWAEATAQGTVTPQVVATYDHATNSVGPPQLLAASPPDNDIHNKPGICIDGQGYLHFVSGTHGTAVMYRRSLAPYSTASGWTEAVPVLAEGYALGDGTQKARQTYDAFVCDSKDVLHLVTRQFRRATDAYFGGAVYSTLIHQSCPSGGVWGPPTQIMVPAEAGYAVFYHKLAMDHRDRLFLSVSSSGGTERESAQTRSAMLRVLGRSARQLGKYQRRMILVSDDGGATWRLASDADLTAPGEATPTPTPTPAPARAKSGAATDSWSWLRPLPAGNQLTSIDIVDGRKGWAVGTHGTILRTVDGGLTWSRQNARTIADLFGVSALNGRSAWIVGQGGLILRTRNGGMSWQVQPSGSTETLFGVAAKSRRRAWVVGGRGLALGTTNGGRSWVRQTTGTHEDLYAVTFTTLKRGWLCGGDGRVRTTWNGGRHWGSQRSVTHKPLYAISFDEKGRGVAVGEDGTTMYSRDGGHSWRAATVAGLPDLRAVRITPLGNVYAGGEKGTLLRSRDRGRTWARRRLPLKGMCGAIDAAESEVRKKGKVRKGKKREVRVIRTSRVWVGGEGGRPTISRNEGGSWSKLPPGVSVSLRAAATSGQKVWLAGANGTLLRQDEPGARWAVTPVPTTATLSGVAAAGHERWVTTEPGTVYHRTEEGSWSLVGRARHELQAVAALGGGRAWVAGADGTLLSTADAGHTWTAHPVTSRDIFSLHFLDDLRGWAGGGSQEGEDHAYVLRTEDGGASWQDVELPIWGRLFDIQFIDALHGWVVGEEWVRDGDVRAGAILATDDGGLTWRLQARSTSALNVIMMIDGARGWAFGEEGATLRTENGGLTWTPQDTGTDAALRAAVPLASGQTLVTGDGGVMLVAPQ